MIFLLPFFISFGESHILFNGTTLSIFNEEHISYDLVSKYNTAIFCDISSSENINILDSAFSDFSLLKNISMKAYSQISIQSTSFLRCTSIESISFDASSFNLAPGTFSSSTSDIDINFKGKNFNSGIMSFITTNINEININITESALFDINTAFQSRVKKIFVTARNVNFGIGSFQEVKNIEKFEIKSLDTIIIDKDAFLNSEIEEIIFSAKTNIFIGQSAFQNSTNTTLLYIRSNGTLRIDITSFLKSSIQNISIQATEQISIGQQLFQECCNITSLKIISENAGIIIDIDSFIHSNIGLVFLSSKTNIAIGQQVFQDTRFNSLIVHTQGDF